MLLDAIWRRRDDFIFNAKWSMNYSLLISTNRRLTDITNARKEMQVPRSSVRGAKNQDHSPNSLGEEWFIVSCDGAVSFPTQRAACGGCILDHKGGFVAGFSKSLDEMSIIQAECWTIFHGLRLALAKNVTKLVIKTDSQQAIELITQGCPLHHECIQTIMAINSLIYQANHVSWGHIWREQNGLADSFAKFGLS